MLFQHMKVAAAVLLLLSAVSLQAAISIFPHAPTSADPITVYTLTRGCTVSAEQVARTGKDIRITLTPGRCPTPPTDVPHAVSIGTLPAGQYHVELTYGSDLRETLTFIVLEANPKLVVRPFVVPVQTSGFPIQLNFTEDLLGGGDWVIDIGGVKYRPRDVLPRAEGLVVNAPDQLAPGLYDITVTSERGTTVVPAAIYYMGLGVAPDLSIFERVLFPVLFRSRGAGGSQWVSEAVIRNPTSFPILNANSLGVLTVCIRYPCGEMLQPKERRAFEGYDYPQGVALLTPRREADNLQFSLRIRDVSRESDSFGTEVPVVREKDMVRNGELTLLDVPLDPRYRTKLRIYVFPDPVFEWIPDFSGVGVRVVLPDGTPVMTQGAVLFSRNCTGVQCAWTPRYSEIDLPARAEGTRADVHVEIRKGGLGWAFASVTNNRTQQVTVVTP